VDRLSHLKRFYQLISRLEGRLGGARLLNDCHGRMVWPQRGVYFFYEDGEQRSDSGFGPRIVRVGTHALKLAGSTTLWNRLSQHRGPSSTGSGNHRGSIFRLIVGAALMQQRGHSLETWGRGDRASLEVRQKEEWLEKEVSKVIRNMRIVSLPVIDEPGPDSRRGYIERHSIALLSNYGKNSLDPPSNGWLGKFSDRKRVRASGLWNQEHVGEAYDPKFLDIPEDLIAST
jgi:hypothetical protein